MVDASVGGSLMKKSSVEVQELIEEMTSNHYQWSNERHPARRSTGVQKLDPFNAMSAKLDVLTRSVKSRTGPKFFG